MRIPVFIALFCSVILVLPAQREAQQVTNGMNVGFNVHTFGLGMGVQYWKQLGKNDLVVELGIASYKHKKEQKIESVYKDQNGKDFVFDKKNYFYALSSGVGLSRVILPTSAHNKVSVRLSAMAGPVLGFLKPYYIEVAVPINPSQARVEEQKYDASQYGYTDIVGEADFFLGMDEMRIVPGLRAKVSGFLDFSPSRNFVRGIELSAQGDFFPKKVEILDVGNNQGIFVGASIGLWIGNAW